jgi:predicted MFS family arabinose efflux permease
MLPESSLGAPAESPSFVRFASPYGLGHHSGVSAEPDSQGTAVAWHDRPAASRLSFALVLALAMGTSTYAGYAFGVLGPHIIDEFEISRFQLGLLTTFFFAIGGPLSLLAGRATDRFGARRVMLLAFGISGVTVLAMAGAPAYPAMLLAAAAAGLALATGNPVTNKLIAVHLPRGRRGLVMGGKQAGVQVGAFLSGALLAPMAVALGWRAALAWSALVPALGLVAALLIIPRDRGIGAAEAAAEAAGGGRLPPGVRWLTVYAFLMGSGIAAVNAYLPLYLVERAGATPELAGAVAATIGAVGIGSRLAWGWASERMPTFSLPLLLLGLGAVIAIGLLLAVEPAGLWLAWPAAVLIGASAVTWNAVGNLAIITESGRRLAGRASGLVTFGFYVGFVASPMAFGLLVDALGSYTLAWALVALVFAATVAVVIGWRRALPAEPAGGEVPA